MIKAVVFDYGAVINRRLRLQRPILELAAELRAKSVKTAVLSNMVSPLAWAVKRRRTLRDFEPAIFSCDIGVRKPNIKSYQIVIERLGLKPEECLFVDNRADNIAGAKGAGMQVVHDISTDQTVADIKRAISST